MGNGDAQQPSEENRRERGGTQRPFPGGEELIWSTEELDVALDNFIAAVPVELPALPSDFGREDIYFDHD
jgi:hypothetical protein